MIAVRGFESSLGRKRLICTLAAITHPFCQQSLSSLNSCLPRKAGQSLSCCDNTREQVLLCGVTMFDEFICA